MPRKEEYLTVDDLDIADHFSLARTLNEADEAPAAQSDYLLDLEALGKVRYHDFRVVG